MRGDCGRAVAPQGGEALLDDLGHQVAAPVQEGRVVELLPAHRQRVQVNLALETLGILARGHDRPVVSGRGAADLAFSAQSRNAMLAIALTWRVPVMPSDGEIGLGEQVVAFDDLGRGDGGIEQVLAPARR